MCVNPDTLLNLNPVDRVVRDAVSVSLASPRDAGSSECIYHLTNDHPPTMGLALGLLFQLLELPAPQYVQSRAQMTAHEQYLDALLVFHRDYMQGMKVFSRRRQEKLF